MERDAQSQDNATGLVTEERLKALVENIPVMVTAYDEAGRIVLWNRECERVTGYEAREVVGNAGAMELLYPDPEYLERLRALWRRRGGDFRNLEWVVTCKDGVEKLVSWSSIARRFPVPGWAAWAIGVDLTGRSRVEELIVRAKREWERTFDSVPDAVAVLDRDFRIRRLNEALAQRLGGRPQDLVDRPFLKLLEEPGRRGGVVSRLLVMGQGDRTHAEELFIPRLGGHFLVTVSPYFLEDEGLAGTIFVAHDISHFKRLEEQLRQSQKLEAIGTLAGGIAHDFNNILGVVMGYTEMALEESAGSESLERKLGQVLLACHRARELITQILTFSRQDTQELRPLRLGPLVKETLRIIRPSLHPSIVLHEHMESADDTVRADPIQIHQVLTNLCTNAIHAMGEHEGVLEISLVDSFVVEEEECRALQLEPGPYVRLGVRDTGCGIEPELLDRIFDPFFTTKKPGEGTGMGLAVVHGIAQKLGGAVHVLSEPGQGTSVQVFLPRSGAEAVEEADMEEPLAPGTGRILLVDDEPALAEISAEMLESLGYRVTVRTGGAEALDAFAAAPDSFDLLLADQVMPGLTGLELADRVLEARPGLPVVLCTGFSEHLSYEQARARGVSRILVKPVPKSRLARTIREALAGC